MLSVWIYTSELSNTMNTILLNAEDIKIGFRCLAELLLEGMKELRNIDFGDAKLENIDNYAFRYCQNLNELDIPNTLTNIGRFAFYK